jgi:mannan endo-1,4-beta-mannosidase
MKSRLVMIMSVAIAAVSVILAASRVTVIPSAPPHVHASLRPSPGHYLGVFERGSSASFEPIAEFGSIAGRQPNLAEYFSGWAEPFEAKFAEMLRSHSVIPFIQIDPTDASIRSIAAGDYDDYLKAYADAVTDFGTPVVIGFGHEMNAPWYPWGYGHVSPATFVAAWRHLVTVFHHEGADNVTWLWTIQADGRNTGPVANWWPGSKYVTWIGIDGFYSRPTDSFAKVFGQTISQVRAFTKTPVLLAETAVGPAAGQFIEIQDLFQGMVANKMLGLVWFDVDQNHGLYQQDWRLEDSPTAATSFRFGVRNDLAAITSPKA